MNYQVCIINIGNELLLGRTVNTNLSWLGKALSDLGLPITRSVTTLDNSADIMQTLSEEWQRNDLVILTGGLGPTNDDITKNVIADFFGKELEFNETVWINVQELFARRGLIPPVINRSQALVPKDFFALSNAKGTAPGLYYRQDNKTFMAMPGVPCEMQSMFTEHLQTIFKETYNCTPIFIEDIHTWNISESALAEKLSDLPIPSSVQLAWLPQTGRVDLRIYGSDRQAIDTIKSQITQKINEWIWGGAMDTPQSVLNELLLKHNYVISVAESCTGGFIQELLTSISGASKIYKGGVIAYDNDVKMSQLKVSKETLDNYGAVSSDTAKEMALGIKNLFNSNIGLSVTGIAGPDGATPEKPIGLVYIGIAFGEQILAHKVVFNGDRNSIRHKAAEYSILTVIDMLKRSV